MLSNARSRRGLPWAMEPVYGLVLRSMVSGGIVNRTGVKWIPPINKNNPPYTKITHSPPVHVWSPKGFIRVRPATGQSSAGNGIRTREYLRNRILSPAPLAPGD